MKTLIDSQKGVHTYLNDNGISLEGKDYREAPFDNRWDDLRAMLAEGTGPAALTYEQYRDTGFFMRFFRHNQPDTIFMTYQMPHGWNKNDVRPHMHFIPMSNSPGTASFSYSYTWANINQEFASSVGWTTGSVGVSISSDDQYKHRVIGFANITPPEGSGASSILIFKTQRVPASDTYTGSKDHGIASANIAILEFDMHYQKLAAGTESEFT
jgi:hypothetical protein